MPASFDPHIVMHCAAIISVAALALRDQLKLRAVLLVSILLSALYNDLKDPGPAWQEMFWNAVTFGINLKVLVQIILDRSAIGFSPEEQELFAALQMLSPGEFRSILKLAVWRTAETDQIITHQGVVPDHLYYVLRGTIHIEKSGRDLRIAPKTFIGEVAFLHGTTASATVRLEAGARYLEWPVRRLNHRIGKGHALQHAMMRVISFDMALKVARA